MENSSNASLSSEDKIYCDRIFTSYYRQISHVNELLHFVQTKNDHFIDQTTDAEAYFLKVCKIDNAIEALRDTLETLTQSIIHKLEKYFANKYCLAFKSLIPEKGHADLDPLPSYNIIIENVTGQVGTDLLQAGKSQIKFRFVKSFYHRSIPILKGEKITIPSFISIDEHYGERVSLDDDHNSRLNNLLNALNLFLNDTTELPPHIPCKVLEWKETLDLTVHYSIFPEVSLKFFKNQRLDVLFVNETTARNFWNYYALEIIDKTIKEND